MTRALHESTSTVHMVTAREISWAPDSRIECVEALWLRDDQLFTYARLLETEARALRELLSASLQQLTTTTAHLETARRQISRRASAHRISQDE